MLGYNTHQRRGPSWGGSPMLEENHKSVPSTWRLEFQST